MNGRMDEWPRVFPRLKRFLLRGAIASLILFLAACAASLPPSPTRLPLAKELILYNWPDYMPQKVLDAFENEYGTRVTIQTYNSQDEAVQNISDGAVEYDVAIIEYDQLPGLIEADLLAEIDYKNIPNFKNIMTDFRDLAVDPGNTHSIPYNWGTSGLIVRGDLADSPVTKWADLWNPRYAGKIGLREEPIELISIALISLGYPLNSEDPQQLEAALSRLIELKKSAIFISSDLEEMLDAFRDGRISILQGWNGDALVAREEFPDIQYVLPSEGTMFWADTFVISTTSPNQYTAEVFINFALRPEISAQIVEAYYYPSANETARQFLNPSILNNPIIYPPRDYLRSNLFYIPLSDAGNQLYEEIWRKFLAATPR